MNKAFIFDMDGVLVDSETVWEVYDKKLFTSLLGADGFLKIKDMLLGSTADVIYQQAQKLGVTMTKKQFIQTYDEYAMQVYKNSNLTNNFDDLIEKLLALNFKIGLLTASRSLWIDQVLPRLKNSKAFVSVVSLTERSDLRPKPYPDGYTEMIQKLGSVPEKTIILEDSNRGIAAAKASGALTICLKENLVINYKPVGADVYMNNLKEVMTFVENYEK